MSGSMYPPLICFSALAQLFPCRVPTPWPEEICVAYTRNPDSPFIDSSSLTVVSTSR